MALSKQDQDLKRLEAVITVLKAYPNRGGTIQGVETILGFPDGDKPVTVKEIIEHLETLALLMS